MWSVFRNHATASQACPAVVVRGAGAIHASRADCNGIYRVDKTKMAQHAHVWVKDGDKLTHPLDKEVEGLMQRRAERRPEERPLQGRRVRAPNTGL